MGLESKISYGLSKHPWIKKAVKGAYQRIMYVFSPKLKSEGRIVRVSPDDGKEYFFGYYDKSPWDASGRYMLCMRAENTWSDPAPKEKARILLIDTLDGNKTRTICETHSWNVQQGCMAQWLGPDFSSRIIYNDCRDGRYVSVIYDTATGKEKVLKIPVYTVSEDGKTALSLDFSRLHRLRKGYGYSNLKDETADEKLPDKPCIFRLDIEKNEVFEVLKYTDLASFEPRGCMQNAEHKVNHLMISPDGKRFMVLHRWLCGARKYTRLVTCGIDGKDMYNLSDDDMVSHCFWKSDKEILAFENKKDGGTGYYLMKDKTDEYKRVWKKLDNDGHPSYAPLPERTLVVTDSYPNRSRIADIKLLYVDDPDGDKMKVIARVFAPFKYDNDTRCDLHPRFSRDARKVCFDSVFEKHRGLYYVDIDQE